MNVVDPAAVAAREEREREFDARIAERARAEQERLDAAGLKVCTNDKACRTEIPADATTCPECRKNQGQSGSGRMSGANRRGYINLNQRWRPRP